MRKLTKKQYQRYGNKQFVELHKELEDFCNSRYAEDQIYIEQIKRKLDRQYLPSWDNVQ